MEGINTDKFWAGQVKPNGGKHTTQEDEGEN